MDSQGAVLTEHIVDAEIVGDNLPAVRASQAIVARDEITVDDLVAQADKVKQAMQRAMKPDIHYGRIPGVNKPTLLKPGAETLCVLLRLAPAYESERIWHDDGHLTVVSRVRLQHIPTGYTVAEGEGLCSSRESKYAYRNADRTCPACGQPSIIKGKQEYGGGWLCFKKKGGCGAKFATADPTIAEQPTGKTANPELPDTFNTVLKMANKRALVAAVLNGTAASDIFTQDVEDSPQGSGLEPSGTTVEEPAAADAKSTVSPVAASASSPVISEAQLRRMYAIAGELDVPKKEATRIVHTVGGVESSLDVPVDRYEAVCAALEEWQPVETDAPRESSPSTPSISSDQLSEPSLFVAPEGARGGE